ncbi:MAG: MFS transporter, partial [Candidatus Dadabacteria bacterium]|nr:MFS transporter [Candidatus Dadabacteria bacterium]NIS09160.1 MFS transporter [Candidatus Dadabacteria bacterium]NIY22467.1 MFS transporter [Candidatus Dadabacteria bacterium]
MPLGLDRKGLINFSLITLANFFFFSNFSTFFLLPLYIKELGGTEADIGFIMGSFGITSLGSIPFVTYLIDRYGRKLFMFAGAVIMLLSSLLFVTVNELSPLLYVFRMCQGMGFALFFTSATTSAADIVPINRRAQGLGIFGAFTILAYSIGPTLGEYVLNNFGFSHFFIAASSFSIVAAVLILFSAVTDFTKSAERFGLGFFRLVASKRYSLILLTNLLLAGGLGSVLNFISAFLKEKELDVYNFFIVYALTVTFVRMFGGRASDVFGRKKVAAPSLIIFSISIACIVFIDSGLAAIMVSFLFSFSYGMLYPVLTALVIDKAGADERGKAMGAYNAC